MNQIISFFCIGFFLAIIVVAVILMLKRQRNKRKEVIKIITLKNGGYKLVIYSNRNSGKFFICDTIKKVLKRLKCYPDNTYVEMDNNPMRLKSINKKQEKENLNNKEN